MARTFEIALLVTVYIDVEIDHNVRRVDVSRSEALWWARESLALLEDQCEIEATYRQSNWSRDLLGYVIIPHSIIEALNCPNHCSQRGVCLHFGCVCQPGFSGLDCGQMDG